MKITRKNLPKSVVELLVEESVENIAKFRKKAFEYLQKNAEVKGFRKGAKIPEEILLKQFGEEHISHLTIDYAIDNLYKDALKKEKLVPVAQGQIKEIVSESPLKIKIEIEVLPEVEVGDKYKKISLKKNKVEVTDSEVESALNDIQTRFTSFVEAPIETKIEAGDRVTIDTDGYEGDKLLENTSMKNYPLVIGSGILVPGFEEQLIGAKVGDDLDLNITFPKNYHNKDFADKKTIFKTKVLKLEKAKKPEFTPEFIEQLRGKKLDLAGFKDLIKEEIKDTKEANARMEDESKLIEELAKIAKFEIGDNLLAHQIDRVFDEVKHNIGHDGIKMSDYLESLKLDEEAYKEKHIKPIAIKRLQGELILTKLLELEKLEVSDEELQKEISKIIGKFQNEEVVKKLKGIYVPGDSHYEELRHRMKYRKLIDTFFKE